MPSFVFFESSSVILGEKATKILNLCIWYGLGECLVQGVGDGKAS